MNQQPICELAGVILFREEHTRRVLVPKVDFISSPGVSAPGVYRPGGPYGLIGSMNRRAQGGLHGA